MHTNSYSQVQKLTRDGVGALYFFGLLALLLFNLDTFKQATSEHPFIMGFLKVALLATFGEFLKIRLRIGQWEISSPIHRFIIWGVFGLWFTVAFPLFSFGVEKLIEVGLWPAFKEGIIATIWLAFSKSLFINVLGGYAFTMMVAHEYCNAVIVRKRFVSLFEFSSTMEPNFWFSFIPKTIFWFWLLAHTITFLLDDVFRVLMAAMLSIALGFILSFREK